MWCAASDPRVHHRQGVHPPEEVSPLHNSHALLSSVSEDVSGATICLCEITSLASLSCLIRRHLDRRNHHPYLVPLLSCVHRRSPIACHESLYAFPPECRRRHSPRTQLTSCLWFLLRWRVIGTLQDSEQFAQAYGCPAGSFMNPTDKCVVW